MGFKVRKAWALAFAPALVLAANTAFAAGGQVVLRTDNGADGYYFGLGGSGVDRYINEYLANTNDPGSVICGIRFRELNQGVIPPPGAAGGDMRAEDAGNPGYPDIVGGLIATVDPASMGTCSASSAVPRIFTFGGGAGVPDPVITQYASAIEPLHGTAGTLDFCGCLLDTNSPYQGFAKYYSGGIFGSLPWNIFVEEIVFTSKRMDLNIRASGSARFPGDTGRPVVITDRPNSGPNVTDDCITLTMSIDNGTGGLIGRNVSICADQSVIDPKKGLKAITGFFRPVGGGGAIMNPINLPPGRTILKLEVSASSVKSKAASIVNKRVLNLPLRALVDVTGVADVDPCALDGGADVDDETQQLGLRRRAGSTDDNTMEAFFVVQSPNAVGDSLNVRFKAIDMPDVAYNVTGFEVVGGEFGGSGLPGLDAIELRTEDPVFSGSPDLTVQGLLRSFGSADGVGEAPLGAPPTTAVFDGNDINIDPTVNPGLVNNLFVLGLLLPGEAGTTTAIGADTAPGDTTLGDSSFTVSGLNPATGTLNNFGLRALLDGDRGTLEGAAIPAEMAPGAFMRPIGTYIAIDRQGNRLR
jgi:hypothetical protein